MKILAMKEMFFRPGLHVLDCQWIDVPLRTLVEREIGSNYTLEIPGLHWRMKRPGNNYNKTIHYAPICFSDAGKEFRLGLGLVVYSSISELVEFVAARIDPDAEGPFSDIARLSLSRSGGRDRSLIEEMLQRESRTGGGDHFSVKDRDLPMEKFSNSATSEVFPFTHNGERFWVLNSYQCRSISLIFAMERLIRVQGHDVPRFVLAKPLMAQTPHGVMEDCAILAFDGDKHLWCRRLDDLPLDLISDLDRDGALYNACDFDVLPLEHLECTAAVRVPPREEIKKLIPEIGGCIQSRTPPHPRLAAPALAFDSHYPVRVPPGVEVLDSPEAALWFLSRTVKAVFIPGQVPRMFPVNNVPEKESFQLLTRPGRLAA
jgi:hypothetical protein